MKVALWPVLLIALAPVGAWADESEKKEPKQVYYEMSLIPSGTFYMGSSAGEGYENEHPRHEVYLNAFWIDRYEVTAKLYRRFAEATKRTFKKQPFPDEANYPVVYVSWEDAQAFCNYHNRRLPTEAEWEKAARGGSWGDYTYGDNDFQLADYAWYAINAGKTHHPVGEKMANAYGLYDVHGNVLEWVSDYYAPDYYGVSPKRNPKGPEKGKHRVVRGGSAYLSAKLLRVTHRMKGDPKTRYSGRGFRCAADMDYSSAEPPPLTQ